VFRNRRELGVGTGRPRVAPGGGGIGPERAPVIGAVDPSIVAHSTPRTMDERDGVYNAPIECTSGSRDGRGLGVANAAPKMTKRV
jgi:hypothetical protein